MNIKKLDLASTLMVLSVTISLGSCDLLKSLEPIKPEQIKSEKIARRLKSIWKETYRKSAEASDKFQEKQRKLDKIENKLAKESNDDYYGYVYNNEEYIAINKEREEAREEYFKAHEEQNKAWDKLKPYLHKHEFDTETNPASSF